MLGAFSSVSARTATAAMSSASTKPTRPISVAVQMMPSARMLRACSSSPYRAEHYERWHSLLRAALEQIPGLTDSDFTAHALLAATRADLVEHLTGESRIPRERMRAQLADFVTRVLASGPLQGLTAEE